ncbi:MAG TPA: hypothetical protein VJT49_16745 [Amycolatopsis sp.]|uniref:hypothetical protein n=1 Tax=Amycolatopsis sp. TaxID=37632 RepID=UPI002B4A00D4|nr:hypothetical protein [Amycolatopsis sp.]HKS46723.1 hypothetical protein [Amycolatopsis sp.]
MTDQPTWPSEPEPVFREAIAAAQADPDDVLREIADMATGQPAAYRDQPIGRTAP